MKAIQLTQNQIALVDDADYPELAKHKWYANKKGKTYYALRHNPGHSPNSNKIAMHRQIMNAKLGQQMDHENRNGIDNRRMNLRFCTHSQNQSNALSRKGTSQYKGVSWYKAVHRWAAEITYKRQRIHLGYFDDEREAALAYDRAALKFFGEFACLNFPIQSAG